MGTSNDNNDDMEQQQQQKQDFPPLNFALTWNRPAAATKMVQPNLSMRSKGESKALQGGIVITRIDPAHTKDFTQALLDYVAQNFRPVPSHLLVSFDAALKPDHSQLKISKDMPEVAWMGKCEAYYGVKSRLRRALTELGDATTQGLFLLRHSDVVFGERAEHTEDMALLFLELARRGWIVVIDCKASLLASQLYAQMLDRVADQQRNADKIHLKWDTDIPGLAWRPEVDDFDDMPIDPALLSLCKARS